MPKTKEQKKAVIQELKDRLQKIKSAVFVNFAGLKMKDAQKLREKSWAEGVDYNVVKKTLLKIALNEAGLGDFDTKKLEGNIGLAFGYSDELAAPKFIADFAKSNESIKILGGILEDKFIEAGEVKSLAALPSKNELLSKLVGSLASPLSGLFNVLQGNLRGLIQVLSAVRDKK